MAVTSRYRNVTLLIAVTVCLLGPQRGWTQEVPKLAAVDPASIQKKAREGSAEAAYILGTMYFHGRGVERDYAKATDAFTRAAELGIGMAQWHLGDLYAEGTKVPENDALAFRWFLAASLQGIAAAQYSLGERYLQARGTPANPREAAYWFQESARQGHAAAQYSLALLYSSGSGVEKDVATAYEWMILAAAQNHPGAIADREALRQQLDEEGVNRAQANAAAFKPRTHYNRAELTRQLDAIKKCVAETPRTQS